MTVQLLKAKLHRIRVTEADLDYEGSLSLDPDDMEAVGILPYEKILCADVENGNRFETYVSPGSAAPTSAASTARRPTWARWATASSSWRSRRSRQKRPPDGSRR